MWRGKIRNQIRKFYPLYYSKMVDVVVRKIVGLLQGPPPIFLGDHETFDMERYMQRLEDVLYTPNSSTDNVVPEHFSNPDCAILCLRVMQLQLLYIWIMNDDNYVKQLAPFVKITQEFLDREERVIQGNTSDIDSSRCPVVSIGEASAWESSAEEALSSVTSCTDPTSKFQLFLSRLSFLAALPRQIYRQLLSSAEEQRYRDAHRRLASWEKLHAVLLLHPSFKDRRRAYESPPSLKALQEVRPGPIHSTSDWARSSSILEQYQESWLSPQSPHRLGVPRTHQIDEGAQTSSENTIKADGMREEMPWPSKRIVLEESPFPGIRPLLPFFQQEALDRRYPEYRDIENELGEAYRALEGFPPSESLKDIPLSDRNGKTQSQGHDGSESYSGCGSTERELVKSLHRLMDDWSEASGIQALDEWCQLYEDAKKVQYFASGDPSTTLATDEMGTALSESHRRSISCKLQESPTWRAVQLSLPFLVQVSHENWIRTMLSDNGEIARHKKNPSVVCSDTAGLEKNTTSQPTQVSTIAVQERVSVAVWMNEANIFRYWMLSCLTADHPERGPNALKLVTNTQSTSPCDNSCIMQKAWIKECGLPSTVKEGEQSSETVRLESLNRLYFPMDVIQPLGFPSIVLLVNVTFHYYEHLNYSPSGYHEGRFDAVVYDETNEKVLCVLLPPGGAYLPRLAHQTDQSKMVTDGPHSMKSHLPPTESTKWIKSKQDMWRFVAALRSALAVSASSENDRMHISGLPSREGYANVEEERNQSSDVFHCEGEVAEFIFDPPVLEQNNDSSGNGGDTANHCDDRDINVSESFKGKEEQFYCLLAPPHMISERHRVSIPLHAWRLAVQVPPQFFKTSDTGGKISLSSTSPQCSLPPSSDRKSSSEAFPLAPGSAAAVLYKRFQEVDALCRMNEKSKQTEMARGVEEDASESHGVPVQDNSFVFPAPPPPLLSSYSTVVQNDTLSPIFDALTLFRKVICNTNEFMNHSKLSSMVNEYVETLEGHTFFTVQQLDMQSSLSQKRAFILDEVRQYLLDVTVMQHNGVDVMPNRTISHDVPDDKKPKCDDVPFIAPRRQALQRELEEDSDFWLSRLGDPDAPPAPRSSSTLGTRSGSAARHRRTPLRRGDSHSGFQLPSAQLRSNTPASERVTEFSSTPPPAGASASPTVSTVRTPLQVLAELLRRKGCSHPLLEMAKKRVTHTPGYGSRHGSTSRGRRSRRSSITMRPSGNTFLMAGGMEDHAEEEVEVAWF